MDFGKILKIAWEVIWTHKVILWFGSLMAVPSIIMGLIMGVFFFFFNEENFPFFFNSYAPRPDNILPFAIVFLILFLVFIIFSYLMMALSFVGVLKGTIDLEKREDTVSFTELWSATRPYLGRVFGVFFLVFFSIFAFFGVIIFAGAIFGAVTAGLGFICLMPFFLLILPLELLAYIFASLSMTAVIAEDLGVFDAIQRGWQVFKEKFWTLVLMGIILIFIQIALNMVIMLPLQVAEFAFFFSVDMNSAFSDPREFFKVFAIIMAIVIPLTSLVQALGLSYANATWMLTYLKITLPSPNLKVEQE